MFTTSQVGSGTYGASAALLMFDSRDAGVSVLVFIVMRFLIIHVCIVVISEPTMGLVYVAHYFARLPV